MCIINIDLQALTTSLRLGLNSNEEMVIKNLTCTLVRGGQRKKVSNVGWITIGNTEKEMSTYSITTDSITPKTSNNID